MNLVQAELERLGARRFVQLMLVLLVAAFAVTVATTVAGSHQPTANELEQAREDVRDQAVANERWLRECRASLEGTTPEQTGGKSVADCEVFASGPPRIEDHLSGVFVFERQMPGLIYFLITFLALFGFLVGASYIGADLNSGGMTNLLLWRPQRLTVLGTKLGTLLGGVLGVSMVASALYLGAFWLVGETRGYPGTLDGDFWNMILTTTIRGWILTLLVTAVGFAIAVLGRHTAAALGVLAGYTVLWEGGARIVMQIIDAPRPDVLMLSSYVGAWILGQIRLTEQDRVCDPGPAGFCQVSDYMLHWPTALLVLLVVVGGLVLGSFAAFRRRDLA
ncbi:ABC transporter permease subunit [Micromonospora sp. NBC_01699]|uniref:ABC transporter permease subunit n=1 Tax=Micromonospora sp. NBC_01699 TaxID=2975984 RepID=UPI002E32D5E3|nr:ABC transporter permease subunit [Micromonospora sp. NBC_01699]